MQPTPFKLHHFPPDAIRLAVLPPPTARAPCTMLIRVRVRSFSTYSEWGRPLR